MQMRNSKRDGRLAMPKTRKPAGREATASAALLCQCRTLIIVFLLMWTATGLAQTVILQTGNGGRPTLEQVVDNLVAKNAEQWRRCSVTKAGAFIVWITRDSPRR